MRGKRFLDVKPIPIPLRMAGAPAAGGISNGSNGNNSSASGAGLVTPDAGASKSQSKSNSSSRNGSPVRPVGVNISGGGGGSSGGGRATSWGRKIFGSSSSSSSSSNSGGSSSSSSANATASSFVVPAGSNSVLNSPMSPVPTGGSSVSAVAGAGAGAGVGVASTTTPVVVASPAVYRENDPVFMLASSKKKLLFVQDVKTLLIVACDRQQDNRNSFKILLSYPLLYTGKLLLFVLYSCFSVLIRCCCFLCYRGVA
jgi:hypothetical protein